MKEFFKKWWFRIFLIAFVFMIHALIYWITPLFIPKDKIEMPTWMVTIFDDCPVLPFTMIFYFGCFAWWIITFSIGGRKRMYEIFWVGVLGYVVIAICFVAFPVTIHWSDDQITGTDFWSNAMRFLRTIDVPEKLFPSIHVFVAAMCYLAVAFDKEKKLWFRIASFLWMLAVWFSTLALKQHYFADGLSAVLLAVILLLIVQRTKLPLLIYKWEAKWTKTDIYELLPKPKDEELQ